MNVNASEPYDLTTPSESPNEADRAAARRYLTSPEHRALFEAFVAFFDKQSRSLAVLDVGCGDGYWMEVLRNLGFDRVIGIDTSMTRLEWAAEKGLNVRHGDVSQLDVLDQFDVVLFCDTLE
ncbi:MAG: class I SAM-dependent methyltransferase, partial [Candidatus Poribacteria bacterium]|nr:class I SAM-dependent methyltransferase [Candidatus Poribacteria bacterium]